jgi:histidinol dehydrogenase
VGPGNLFVTLAKRAVFGSVGIDGLAGPSEVLIVASEGADPRLVAADLVSQLEHDPLAWAVFITDSGELARRVEEAFVPAAESAVRHGIIAAAAGRHGMTVVCADLEEALALVDDFAPEHLELQGRPPRPSPTGCAPPEPSSSAPTARCRWATTSPAPTTPCPPAAPRASRARSR